MELSDDFRLLGEPRIEVAFLSANIPQNRKRYKVIATVFNIFNRDLICDPQNLMNIAALSSCVSLIMLLIDLYLNFLRKPFNGESLGVSYQVWIVIVKFDVLDSRDQKIGESFSR